MMPEDVMPPRVLPIADDTVLIEKFDQSIEKLDSLIEAGKQAKGKGKLGLMQGRFVSSAYNTDTQWKVMRWAGNFSESVDRSWKRLNSDEVFNELERLSDELAVEIQETGDRLQEGSPALEKFNLLKQRIAEAKEEALKPLLSYYEKNLKIGDAKSQRYYLRCKGLEAQFSVEKLKTVKIELKEFADHSRKLSKLIKSRDSKEEVLKALDQEIDFIAAHPEKIRKFCGQGGTIWKDYLTNLSKLAKIDPEKGRPLFEKLILIVADWLPRGSCERNADSSIKSICAYLYEGGSEENFKMLLSVNSPRNLLLLSLATAAGVWDPQQHLHLLAEPTLEPLMVESFLRDLSFTDVDVDATSAGGDTLLHHAINNRNIPLVAQLLEMGARIDIANDAGFSPLSYAFKLLNENDQSGIGEMILESFESRYAEKIANPIDMSFKPTKLKQNIGARGKKNKHEKYLDKTLDVTTSSFEIIEGAFGPAASIMSTQRQLSKVEKQRALIDLEIRHKEEKMKRSDIDDLKFHRLMDEISELEEHKKTILEAGQSKNAKKIAGTTSDTLSFAADMLQGTESEVLQNILPGVDIVTGSLKIYRQVKGIENEARKVKLINQILETLVKEAEILGNLEGILVSAEEPFKARVMGLKKMETENKIRFMFRQRDLIANQTNASVVSTGATAIKAIGKIASVFVPGLGLVIGAATLVSYAPKMVSGYAMAKEWGKLKETHFKPIDPLKLTKEMKKQICRRLGIPIKQLDPTFLEAKQLMTHNDKIWLKQMLIQAGVLAETDEDISDDKMAHLIAALIID